MEFMDIMKKSSDYVKTVNEAMRDLEIAKGYMDEFSTGIHVTIANSSEATPIEDFLPNDFVQGINSQIVTAINLNYDKKYSRLKELVGDSIIEATVAKQCNATSTEQCNVADNRPVIRPWEIENTLRADYITAKKSVKSMAAEYGCSTGQVYNGLKKFGICRPPKDDPFYK